MTGSSSASSWRSRSIDFDSESARWCTTSAPSSRRRAAGRRGRRRSPRRVRARPRRSRRRSGRSAARGPPRHRRAGTGSPPRRFLPATARYANAVSPKISTQSSVVSASVAVDAPPAEDAVRLSTLGALEEGVAGDHVAVEAGVGVGGVGDAVGRRLGTGEHRGAELPGVVRDAAGAACRRRSRRGSRPASR